MATLHSSPRPDSRDKPPSLGTPPTDPLDVQARRKPSQQQQPSRSSVPTSSSHDRVVAPLPAAAEPNPNPYFGTTTSGEMYLTTQLEINAQLGRMDLAGTGRSSNGDARRGSKNTPQTFPSILPGVPTAPHLAAKSSAASQTSSATTPKTPVAEQDGSSAPVKIFSPQPLVTETRKADRIKLADGRIITKDVAVQAALGDEQFVTLEWENGDVYEGYVLDGKMHRHGTCWFAQSQCIYRGEWRRGQCHGRGQLWDPINAEEYEGSWKDGMKYGFGTLLNLAENWKYMGHFVNNLRHGHGILETELGKYDCEWKFGRKEGEGKVEFTDGSLYIGHFVNDEFHGHGSFHCSLYKYTGQWIHGKMHGRGRCTFRGDYVFDYTGDFVEGFKQGKGIENMTDGTRFEGVFHRNVREGEGTFTYVNGDTCSGVWSGRLLQGLGTYKRKSDGASVLVISINGKLVEAEPN